jgi:hypothetical protein
MMQLIVASLAFVPDKAKYPNLLRAKNNTYHFICFPLTGHIEASHENIFFKSENVIFLLALLQFTDKAVRRFHSYHKHIIEPDNIANTLNVSFVAVLAVLMPGN